MQGSGFSAGVGHFLKGQWKRPSGGDGGGSWFFWVIILIVAIWAAYDYYFAGGNAPQP